MSNLLWAAFGINREQIRGGKSGRTAASASNSQEIDLYVALPDGVYLYEAMSHRLKQVTPGDHRKLSGRGAAASAPVNIFYVVDLSRYDTGPTQPDRRIGDPEVQKSYYFVDTVYRQFWAALHQSQTLTITPEMQRNQIVQIDVYQSLTSNPLANQNRINVNAYIDLDPCFTQVWHAAGAVSVGTPVMAPWSRAGTHSSGPTRTRALSPSMAMISASALRLSRASAESAWSPAAATSLSYSSLALL